MSLFAANVLMASVRKHNADAAEKIPLKDSQSRPDVPEPSPVSNLPYSDTKRIKVIPYANVRQVLGLALLVVWPVLLGTAFNIYGFKEAHDSLGVRMDVKQYQARFVDVQATVEHMVEHQDILLSAMRAKIPWQTRRDLIKKFRLDTEDHLNALNNKYPELSRYHTRVTPATVISDMGKWAASKNRTAFQPATVIITFTEFISKVKQFYAAYHGTTIKGGATWSNMLQQLYPSEVIYRTEDAMALGKYAYDNTTAGQPMDSELKLYLLRRNMRSTLALELLDRYAVGQFRRENVRLTCTSCNWSVPRLQDYSFWKPFLLDGSYLETDKLKATKENKNLSPYYSWSEANSSMVYRALIGDAMYPAMQILKLAKGVVARGFQQDLHISAVIFAVVLAFLILWLILVIYLFSLFGASLGSIFSESYRFQWIQLCRRRAIEREKTRSDKIVQEMFFEVNFKHLYEGELPPMVVYPDATIAFVELMQYDQLCKIYSSVDHVAILDWYYHMVSTAVKSFSVNLVATAGHYCLLAGTNSYHAENVALALLRLMSLARESFLPPPHQTRLPLVKGGMHSGRVAGAIVSLKFPLFTMLGDTVNTAARMNSKSKPYRVLISRSSYLLIKGDFGTKEAGTFNVKGKGEMVAFWLLNCSWDAFVTTNIDLEAAEDLAQLHDLEHRASKDNRHARTAIGRPTRQDDLWSSTGGGRGSSFGSSMAGLGSTLLQGLLKAKRKKRRQSRPKKDTLTPERRTQPNTMPTIANGTTGKLADPTCEKAEAKGGIPWLTRLKSTPRKSNEPISLASQVDVKASPNDSYYIQVANTATMRSWNHK